MSFLCTVGLHDWKYTSVVYKGNNEKILGITEYEVYRKCDKCNVKQRKSTYCLGLQPPKYESKWIIENEKNS